jgi:threonylcarbamoyladenosine tRNA methylthiotransferase MtaB
MIKGQINGIVKSLRVNRLIGLNEELATDYINSYKNQVVSALFEKSDEEFTYGHSDTYIYLKVNKDIRLHNTIQNVLIKNVKYKDTLGIIKS